MTLRIVCKLAAIGGALALGACSSSSSTASNTDDSGVSADVGANDSAVSANDSGSTSNDSGSTSDAAPSDSGAAATDSGGDAGADANGSGNASDADCKSYCQTITANCAGTVNEYLDIVSCLAMCANMKAGAMGDQSMDTLACRSYHAGLAKTNATLHCKHAGPGGADVCGPSHCTAFCEQDIALCGAGAGKPYASQADCETACNGYTYNQTTGDLTDQSNNTFNCRLWHLEKAFTSTANMMAHCPHTAQASATCVH